MLGTLITGAARLMLAITERLVTDAELEWAFCDTDSMAIAKPESMVEAEFQRRVDSVVQSFAGLNPYAFSGSILQVEKVNKSLETGEAEPLYCFAISSKRYALFNLNADRQPVMRKASAHGLGHLIEPYREADAPPGLPVPHPSVLRDGVKRWHCDLWHVIVTAALNGKPEQVRLDYHPALNKPAISRYSATSPELLRWYNRYNVNRPYRDQVKPFGFLLALTAADTSPVERVVGATRRGRPKKVKAIAPVAPYDTDIDRAAASAFDRNSGDAVPLTALKTFADTLRLYHLSPEPKFRNGRPADRGTTIRRYVRMIGTRHIGKESHDWERQAALALSRVEEIDYGESGNATAAHSYNEDPGLRDLRNMVQRDGLRATARRLGLDPSNLRRRLNGKPADEGAS